MEIKSIQIFKAKKYQRKVHHHALLSFYLYILIDIVYIINKYNDMHLIH